jgi:hypothetical protein
VRGVAGQEHRTSTVGVGSDPVMDTEPRTPDGVAHPRGCGDGSAVVEKALDIDGGGLLGRLVQRGDDAVPRLGLRSADHEAGRPVTDMIHGVAVELFCGCAD